MKWKSSNYRLYCSIANHAYDELTVALPGLSGAGNLLNAVLDPILIFVFGFGIGGAAISTVISEYVSDVVNL